VGQYYGEWDQLNVEKALLEEEGGDPSLVPERASGDIQDFGIREVLDVTYKITRFSWDQSDKFVSLYLPFDGVGALPAEDVQVIFRPVGVLLLIRSGGKQHWYKVPNLCKAIDTNTSVKKVKADQVVIKLRKETAGEQWSDLTDEKDLYQKRRQFRIQHGDLKGATTEELLADMYKHATDEERVGLRDAMKVNREKREADARAAK